MAANDTISDMLTRIRNSCLVKHQTTKVPSTKMTVSIAKVLQEEGFINNYEETGEGVEKFLSLSLKYHGKNRQPTISTLKRVSKPGLRVIPRRRGNQGNTRKRFSYCPSTSWFMSYPNRQYGGGGI